MKYFLPTILILLSISSFAQKNKKQLYNAPFGIQAWSFRNSFPIDPAKTMDTIKMMGFTEIEGLAKGLTAAQLKKLCDERGISIPAIHADYKLLTTDPMSVIADAKTVGAKYVMTAWIPHEGNFSLEHAKKAVEDFNKVGKIMADNGLVFGYHTHGFEFYPHENGTLMDYIIQNTDPKYVSFEMDILWVHFGGGDPVGLLNKYGDRWKLMHIKDLKKGTPKNLSGGTDTENDVAVGTGEIDIKAILKAAKKVGIKHYFIEDESSSVSKQAPQSISYLKGLTE